MSSIPRTPLPSGRVSGGEYKPGLIAPTLSPNDTIINPVRPIWEHKFGNVSLARGKNTTKWRKHFASHIRTEFDMSVRESLILAGRPKADLIRILRNLECLLDNFLLFDKKYFKRDHILHSSMKRIIRVTLKISTYSVDDQIGKWKDFVHHFISLASKAETEKGISTKWNPYKFLLEEGKFKQILDGDCSREMMVSMAHIISTRNLANGGAGAKRKALAKFKTLTGSEFKVSLEHQGKLRLATQRVTNIALAFSDDSWRNSGHCSLNSSGVLDVPISQGGKATDALLDLNKFLNEVSTGDTREYPWGTLYYPAGRPRWQAWGRAEHPPEARFMSRMTYEIIDRGAMHYGSNEHTGSMLFTCAYEMYRKYKESSVMIPIRQATVSEPGGKARIITTGPWWLTILQQPFAHIARQLIGYHPSSHSCLLRCDQAWQALKVLEKCSVGALEDTNYWILSSDLEAATDTLPHDVCRALLSGFLAATNLTEWIWMLDFIGPRNVFNEDYTFHTLTRGVMMGEPLSKVCLVLLGLAVEEIAFSDFMGLALRRPYTPKNVGRWRAFHLGGDDHLAVGPKQYLNKITATYRSFGAIVSPEKHRQSRVFSVYTEKVLLWRNTRVNHPVRESTGIASPFIDSIKVRLLSPFTKATESENDKNIAIGKCRGLSRSLEYFGNQSTKQTVLDRAAYRFRNFVSNPHHKTIWSIVCMPTAIGGLGLGIDNRFSKHLPEIFNKALRAILQGGPLAYRVKNALGRIFANTDPRGIKQIDFVEKLVDQFLEFPTTVDLMSRNAALDIVDPNRVNNFAFNLWLLAKKDIVPIGNIHSIAERPYLFRKLLEREMAGKYFRTEPIKRRIAKCWDELENFELPTSGVALTEDELREVVRSSKMIAFVDLNIETTVALADTAGEGYSDEDPWTCCDFVTASLRKQLTFGEPSMRVGFSAFGPPATSAEVD